MARNLPDIIAVDPLGCGCNECSFGEYVPEDVWYEKANVDDVVALLNGEVGVNIYSEELYDLTIETYYKYNDYEVSEFLKRVRSQLMRDLGTVTPESFLY